MPMDWESTSKCLSLLPSQADTEEEKNNWVQDIWDLFFGHMLSLKGEQNT